MIFVIARERKMSTELEQEIFTLDICEATTSRLRLARLFQMSPFLQETEIDGMGSWKHGAILTGK